MRRTVFASLAALVALSIASQARADILAPGVGFNQDVSATYDTFSIGGAGTYDPLTYVASTSGSLAPPSSGHQKFFGTFSEWVYTNSAGGLTYIYQINLNSSTTTSMDRITTSNFTAPIITDVGVLTGAGPASGPTPVAGGVSPTDASDVIDRSGILSDGGATIGWNFKGASGPITKGLSSVLLVVGTNSPTFAGGGTLSGIDGSSTSNNVLQPGPEPSSMVLAGLGVLGLVGYGLRRRKALGA